MHQLCVGAGSPGSCSILQRVQQCSARSSWQFFFCSSPLCSLRNVAVIVLKQWLKSYCSICRWGQGGRDEVLCFQENQVSNGGERSRLIQAGAFVVYCLKGHCLSTGVPWRNKEVFGKTRASTTRESGNHRRLEPVAVHEWPNSSWCPSTGKMSGRRLYPPAEQVLLNQWRWRALVNWWSVERVSGKENPGIHQTFSKQVKRFFLLILPDAVWRCTFSIYCTVLCVK